MKEEHFIKGVIKNQADSYDKYEDVIDEKIKKEIVDQSPSIDELVSNKDAEVEESNDIEYKHVGPDAHKYDGMSAEEIDEQIHEQLKSQYPDQYPEYINPDTEGLRDAIGKAYEQHNAEEFRKHESINQRHKDMTWSDVPPQTKDIDRTLYGGYAGKDNLKTINKNTPEKRQRGLRGLIRRLFKTEPELIITEKDYTSIEENIEIEK